MINANKYFYSFEIETILQQFMAVIDNAIVMRYNKNQETGERTIIEEITPNYIFGTKSRVLAALVNPNKNFTLPVIAVTLSGIKGDNERITSKHEQVAFFNNSKEELYSYNKPLPITITVALTILSNYVTDVYQMWGKLATEFRNGYTVYSWFVPGSKNVNDFEELNNKITWDYNAEFDFKDDRKETDEDRFSCKMSFNIEGWLFPQSKFTNDNIITDIGTTIINNGTLTNRIIGEGENPDIPLVDKAMNAGYEYYNNPREFASARPIMNYAYCIVKNLSSDYAKNKSFVYFDLRNKNFTKFAKKNGINIIINGYNMNTAKALITPVTGKTENAGNVYSVDGNELVEVTKKYPDESDPGYTGYKLFPFKKDLNSSETQILDKPTTISGYELPVEHVNPTSIKISLNNLEFTGEYDIIIYNDSDYDTLKNCTKNYISIV